MKYIEQSGSEQVDNKKDVRIFAVRGKKVATTTVNTFSFSWSDKRGDGKVWEKKDNKDKRGYCKGKKEAIRRRERIFEISVYHHMIYKWVD